MGSSVRLNFFSLVYFIALTYKKYDTVLVIALGFFLYKYYLFDDSENSEEKKYIDLSMSKGSCLSHKYSFCQDLIIRCPSQCLSGIDLC